MESQKQEIATSITTSTTTTVTRTTASVTMHDIFKKISKKKKSTSPMEATTSPSISIITLSQSNPTQDTVYEIQQHDPSDIQVTIEPDEASGIPSVMFRKNNIVESTEMDSVGHVPVLSAASLIKEKSKSNSEITSPTSAITSMPIMSPKVCGKNETAFTITSLIRTTIETSSTSRSVTPASNAPSTSFTQAQSATQVSEHESQLSSSGSPSRINEDPNTVESRPDEASENSHVVRPELKEQVISEAKDNRHVIIFPKRITTCRNILKRLRSMIPYCQVKETLKYDVTQNVIMDILYPKDALLTLWSTNTSKVYLPYDAKFQAEVKPSTEESNVMKNEYFFCKLVTCHYCQQSMLLTLECHSNGKTFLYDLPRKEVRPFALDQTMKLVHSSCLTEKQIICEESDECNNFLFKISRKDRPYSQWDKRDKYLPVKKLLLLSSWLFLLLIIAFFGYIFKESHMRPIVIFLILLAYACFFICNIADFYYSGNLWRKINKTDIVVIWRPLLTITGENYLRIPHQRI